MSEINPEVLARERDKYTRCYAREEYKMGVWRFNEAATATAHWEPARLLDVGCGRGEFIAAMEKRGFEAHGTDVVDALLGPKVSFAWGHNLPFHNREFHYVTSWDVIEHVPPGDEVLIFQEMRRVAFRGVALSINLMPSSYLGLELHLNLRSIEEWTALLCPHFGDNYSLTVDVSSPIWVFDLNA